MAVEIVMPRLSDTMEEGRIIKWLKQVGDTVTEGEPLLEVETDKADIEVEAFDTGVLLEITVEEGETVQVGEKIGLIGAADEAPAEPAAAEPTPAKEAPKEAEVEEKAEEPEPEEKAEPVEPEKEVEKPKEEEIVAEKKPKEKAPRGEPAVSIHMETQEAIEKFVARRAPEKKPASPLAKELAQKHGIDLSEIKGTGPGGEVVKRDIESAAAKEGAKEPVADEPPEKEIKATPLAAILAEKEGVDLEEITGTGIDGRIREIDVKAYVAKRCALRGEEYQELSLMRKTIARRMTESKQSIPHFYLTMAIEMDAAIEFRKRLNEGRGDEEKISVNDIIVKAAALALGQIPEVNSSFADEKIKVNDAVNIGNATTTPDGLIVPVIFDADKKSVAEIAAETKDKAERARKRKLRPDEYSNATFTVSNLGMFGIEQFSAIIDPGQSAILAVGAAVKEPVIVNGDVKVKNMMRVTLSCDHRVIDGYTGTQYLLKLKSILEDPEKAIT
jgi:pyruvate dehydrogenase E2 component (dihydrolipoamide acetyltransferase)